MLFYLTSRIVGTATSFLYPAYCSYKTLSQRPASEADLERWLMYWSVLGTLLSLELFAEWAISWLPFYYTIKTLFLLYLSLPQTQGSTFIYHTYLAPLLHEHEDQIDRSMSKIRGIVWEFVQTKARALWDALVASLGQQPGAPPAGSAVAPPPTQNDPVSGPAQMAFGLWRTYGPTILTTGVTLFRQVAPGSAPQAQPQGGQARTASFFAERPPAQPYPDSSSSHISNTATQSVLERRRALEAELAALERIGPSSGSDVSTPSSSSFTSPIAPTFPIPSIPLPGTSLSASTSRTSSPVSSYPRERTSSGVGLGRFEEIEMPPTEYVVAGEDHDGVGHAYDGGRPVQSQRRTSWFGWGQGGQGYDRVKND
ncbi:hypothetical protein E1B28_006344 [Marasmius oreades]|uniref:Protein YOP1 n=1 Tax=Marasmius oreades TaxID=181124 RepID=A0A9P7S5P0_9AGAR|nr:uncharacterized protein E1B28_006344 [Marasmius oreades]KAG7095620.1 hypothetical protein E1B28_006344 [Marasmius oreades]